MSRYPDLGFLPSAVLDTGLVFISPLIATVRHGVGFPPRGSTTVVL